MKLLLLIVSITAVSFTVNGRDLALDDPGENPNYGWPDYEGTGDDLIINTEEQEQIETPSKAKARILELQLEENVHGKKELRKSVCKARITCVLLGGVCVTNGTSCSGRLVAEGCKGAKCQCCVPDTLAFKIESLEKEIQSMKNSLNKTKGELIEDIRSMQSNNTVANINLQSELQSLNSKIANGSSKSDRKMDAIEKAISNQNARMNSYIEHQDCFLVSYQCFRFYMDIKRTWSSAKTKCESEGLRLAEPADSIAASLRRQVVYVFGNAEAWVGAQGTGSQLMWQKRRTYLKKESTLLDGGRGSSSSMSSSYCLELDALQSQHDAHYSSPYDVSSCTSHYWTLCEVVQGLVN